MIDLTVLTCACHRPEAWALSEFYMRRQTLQPVQWIVLDDDTPWSVCTMGQEYVHNTAWAGRGALVAKLRYALERNMIRGSAVVIWENDDWYDPRWLQIVASWLEQGAIVGEGKSLYYNVRGRWWMQHKNMWHASLCETAFRRDTFADMLRILQTNTDPYIDCRLWPGLANLGDQPPADAKLFPYVMADPDVTGMRLSVGIKGMPGKNGYGVGHQYGCLPSGHRDPLGAKLREVIGEEDTQRYDGFYVPQPGGAT